MIGSVTSQLRTPRINDDGRFALDGKLLDLGTCHRMCIRRVGANHQYTVGVLDIFHRVGCRSGTKAALHAQGRRRVAYAGAAVDVVGTYDRADKLLHQVVFFVGRAGRGYARDGIRSVLIADCQQFFCDKIIGFFPGDRLKATIFAQQR